MDKEKMEELENKLSSVVEEIEEKTELGKLKERAEQLDDLRHEYENHRTKVNEAFQKLVTHLTTRKRVSVNKRITIREDEGKICRYGRNSHWGQISLKKMIKDLDMIRKGIKKGRDKEDRVKTFNKVAGKLKELKTGDKVIKKINMNGDKKLRYEQNGYKTYAIVLPVEDEYENKKTKKVVFQLEDVEDYRRLLRVRHKIGDLINKVCGEFKERKENLEEVLNFINEYKSKYDVLKEL